MFGSTITACPCKEATDACSSPRGGSGPPPAEIFDASISLSECQNPKLLMEELVEKEVDGG